MNNLDIKINKIAQKIIPMGEGLAWFQNQMLKDTGSEILQQLSIFIQQAHPTSEEIDNAIEFSELRPTFTPCVLVKSKAMKEALSKIVNLPKDEQLKSFKLLIALLSIADERRRNTECKLGCSHEWHNM
jgi:hypothetical protein